MKLHYSILYLTLITFIGCKTDQKANYAFLGGEIINATNNFIIISNNETVLDTIKLDGNNRFIYKINDLKTGFHTFKHGAEMQMVLLEPNDSIMFRLNTYEFDESLVFTGIGAKKNNYFINEYLQNELEEKRVFKYCQLNSKTFSKRIDSIKDYKNKKLNKFKEKHSPSDLFVKIAQSNIDYNYYARKEIYPFIHYGKNKRDIIKTLPNDFYAYRKSIDYNNQFDKNHFIYNKFLKSNLNSLALKNHTNHDSTKNFTINSICFNLDKLHLIDSLIKIPELKNKMLFHSSYGYLSKNNATKNNEALLKSFLQKSTDVENNTIISNLVIAINKLKVGNTFPEISISDYKNGQTVINKLINKPTVIYFWSHNFYEHFKDSHIKIKALKDKYPEIDFIAINIDNPKSNTWLPSLQNQRFPTENEYQLNHPKKAKELLAIYPITKVFILDENKKIVHSHTNLFISNFEEQLLGLISQ